MLKTLLEAKQSRSLKTVAAKCPNSDEFVDLVNEASRRLLNRGDWYGTVVPIQVCVTNGCIVWPRYVGHVRKMNVCNQPVPMRNSWYTFLQYDNPRFYEGWLAGWGYGSYDGGYSYPNWYSGLGSQVFTTGGVETPVFQDIMGDGRLLRFYPQVQADVGKNVIVFGTDNNGQILRRKTGTDTWEDGWELTLAIPYVSTSDYVRHIDRILFDDHEGPIRAFAYNVADDVLEDVGSYEAHDNNPSFVRYNLSTGVGCNGGEGCGCIRSVTALVKLRYVPAIYDTDLVLIDNLDALKLMIQCIRYEEAGERAQARAAEADAIHELNLQLNDAFPVEQTPVGNGVFAGTCVGIQRCF